MFNVRPVLPINGLEIVVTSIVFSNSSENKGQNKVNMLGIIQNIMNKLVKNAMPVSFRLDLFTSYTLTIFRQCNLYFRKYVTLPNIVIHACNNITENMNL